MKTKPEHPQSSRSSPKRTCPSAIVTLKSVTCTVSKSCDFSFFLGKMSVLTVCLSYSSFTTSSFPLPSSTFLQHTAFSKKKHICFVFIFIFIKVKICLSQQMKKKKNLIHEYIKIIIWKKKREGETLQSTTTINKGRKIIHQGVQSHQIFTVKWERLRFYTATCLQKLEWRRERGGKTESWTRKKRKFCSPLLKCGVSCTSPNTRRNRCMGVKGEKKSKGRKRRRKKTRKIRRRERLTTNIACTRRENTNETRGRGSPSTSA